MKHILNFNEFLNEQTLNEETRHGGFWYRDNVAVKKDKLSDGTPIEIRLGDILEDMDTDKSLGIKINMACTWDKPGSSTPRYSVYKLLTGPSKGSILFNEETFVRTSSSVSRTSNWYSEIPKVYAFKDAVACCNLWITASFEEVYEDIPKI